MLALFATRQPAGVAISLPLTESRTARVTRPRLAITNLSCVASAVYARAYGALHASARPRAGSGGGTFRLARRGRDLAFRAPRGCAPALALFRCRCGSPGACG